MSRGMTSEEAISLLRQVKEAILNSNSWDKETTSKPITESFDMAIKALQEQKSRKITSKELLDKLDSVAWNCYERGNTVVGCMGCEYMKDKSCLLRLNGVPVDWVREKGAKDESNNM